MKWALKRKGELDENWVIFDVNELIRKLQPIVRDCRLNELQLGAGRDLARLEDDH